MLRDQPCLHACHDGPPGSVPVCARSGHAHCRDGGDYAGCQQGHPHQGRRGFRDGSQGMPDWNRKKKKGQGQHLFVQLTGHEISCDVRRIIQSILMQL